MFKTIALSYRMGQRTVSKIVYDVCGAIWKHLQPIYPPEPTTVMWENIASDFERKWQFYNCLGAVDGKHIILRKPQLSGSSFFNYKQHGSVVLMATVDAHYRFTSIDVGSMGGFSDGNIFSNSVLGRKLTDGTLKIPGDKSLPGQQNRAPYVFVGDEAFPLLKNLMRPYPKCRVTGNDKYKVYNYRLSRARQTVECAFGILSSRFRVFKRPFECKLETVDRIVTATCVLHNYLRTDNITSNDLAEEDDMAPLSTNQLMSPAPSRCRNESEAFLTREKFNECFNSPEGSVQWQYAAIKRGQY
ncbi:uncharacterized protein LOC126157015 [Schistocerca cancellata]|uniref:uncharacterized protein LOC126157015 n=1 Tax=Schistocerca cancellata TaxID=274614 RepID=UPI0021199BEE|nr:uncharacterized protein LOC126157015 [Schistocerca cancellata]